jgi:hypothetical protein
MGNNKDEDEDDVQDDPEEMLVDVADTTASDSKIRVMVKNTVAMWI